MDLIDRKQALKAVSWDSEAYFAINNLPSAEKTGKWVMLSPMKKLFYCSECGQWGEKYWNYCPNCGARMVGDEH